MVGGLVVGELLLLVVPLDVDWPLPDVDELEVVVSVVVVDPMAYILTAMHSNSLRA